MRPLRPGLHGQNRADKAIQPLIAKRPLCRLRRHLPQGGERSALSKSLSRTRTVHPHLGSSLPPCGGDVGAADGGAQSAASPLHLPGCHPRAGGRVLAVLQLDALSQKLVADAVGSGEVLLP